MRISQLSDRTGQTVGTLKFYIRSGLLHAGTSISATQSSYDETHVQRIRLIRALLEVGRLSHAEIGEVVGAIESRDPLPARLHRACDAGGLRHLAESSGVDQEAARKVMARLGWNIAVDSPHLIGLARAMQALDDLGMPVPEERVAFYAARAQELAQSDVEWAEGTCDEEMILAASSMVLWEQVFGSLHRLAAEHEAERRSLCEPARSDA